MRLLVVNYEEVRVYRELEIEKLKEQVCKLHMSCTCLLSCFLTRAHQVERLTNNHMDEITNCRVSKGKPLGVGTFRRD